MAERLIVNAETGVVESTLNEGDRIFRKESTEKLSCCEPIPKGEKFLKVYCNALPILRDERLNLTEMTIFLYLMEHIRWDSLVAKFENGVLITRTHIMKEFEVSEITMKRAMANLIKKTLIVSAKTAEGTVFIINPYIIGKGVRVSKTTMDLFRMSKYARW